VTLLRLPVSFCGTGMVDVLDHYAENLKRKKQSRNSCSVFFFKNYRFFRAIFPFEKAMLYSRRQ